MNIINCLRYSTMHAEHKSHPLNVWQTARTIGYQAQWLVPCLLGLLLLTHHELAPCLLPHCQSPHLPDSRSLSTVLVMSSNLPSTPGSL